ncbi:MAG: AsmA-like C-terminal region-containing protein [Saprospiraceae bacterium]
MRRFWLRGIKYLGIGLLLLIILAFLLPIFFKKDLLQFVKNKSNEGLNGRLEFADLEISLFKHFPRLNISLIEPILYSYVNQDTTQLFMAKDLSIALDLWNLITKKDQLDIKGFYLNKAEVFIKNYSVETSNLNVFSTDTNSTSDNNLFFKLSDYELNISKFNYIDSGSMIHLSNLFHKGKMNLNGDKIDLSTTTNIDSITYSSASITYLSNARFNSVLDLNIDKVNHTYLFKKNDLKLNELKLSLEGMITMPDSNIVDLDLKIFSPGNEFKELFSIIPKTFTKDYTNVQSGGSFKINGWVKGIYDTNLKTFPSWKFETDVKDGSIQYKEMPVKLEKVMLNLITENSSKDLSNMTVSISPFNFQLNRNPFEGNFMLSDFKSDMHVISKIIGQINLVDFKNFIPLDKGIELAGLLDVNIKTDFRESQVTSNSYDKIKLEGLVNISNLLYKDPSQPSVLISSGSLNMNPKTITISKLEMQLGKSDLSINGLLENPLAIVSKKSKLTGKLEVYGNLLDANEWLVESSDKVSTAIEPSSVPEIISKLILNINANFNEIKYDTYKIKNANSKATLADGNLVLNPFSLNINENNISGTAELLQIMDYVYYDKTLKGNLNLNSVNFDANKFLAEDAAVINSAPSEAFLVPKGMDININFNSKSMLYDKLNLQDLKAKLKIVNDEIQFNEISSSSMGGSMYLMGIYNSENPNKPRFDLKYDLRKLSFPKIFESIKTFRIIAPIAKFIEGQFNSSFVFSGTLGKDMSPDLNSINIGGIFETIDASIKNYKPLESIANKLSIKELKNLSLKNTKNYFTVENGQVNVKELNYKFNDIDLSIQGTSKLQGAMDFSFKFKIPRNKLNQNVVGQTAETGLNFIKSLGQKVGMNIDQGSNVNILVNLTGKLLDPEIKFKLLGSDGQPVGETVKDVVNDVVDKAKDSLRNRANEEIDKVKDKALNEANRIEDSIRKAASKKIEDEKNKILDKATEEAKKKLDSTLVKQGRDILNDKVGSGADKILKDSSVDKIKDKIKDWNPFKKK